MMIVQSLKLQCNATAAVLPLPVQVSTTAHCAAAAARPGPPHGTDLTGATPPAPRSAALATRRGWQLLTRSQRCTHRSICCAGRRLRSLRQGPRLAARYQGAAPSHRVSDGETVWEHKGCCWERLSMIVQERVAGRWDGMCSTLNEVVHLCMLLLLFGGSRAAEQSHDGWCRTR